VRTVGDRRHISVLFFDVVDASALSERLDPEDLRDLLQSLHAACESAVVEHGGHIAQRLGDGLLAYFGYPQALEDGPRRAVQAGLATLREARARARLMQPRVGALVQTRLGIHTGPVVLDDMGTPDRPEMLAIGETPNKAARVQAAAQADTVVVSESTFRLTRGFFRFVDLGLERLRGFSEPVRLHAVADETDAQTKLDASGGELTPFVNREEPLRLLRAKWEEARHGGAPVVAISGEAGIGKSRVTRVFRDGLDADGALFVTCYCSSYFQSTALWPIADMLDRWLSSERVEPQEKLRRLRRELSTAGVGDEGAAARIAALLSPPAPQPPAPLSTAQRERQQTFEALLDWLMRRTLARPVLLLVEDLHWVDPSTLEFLSLLAQRTPPGPLMTVLTHRPEFELPWTGPRHTTLKLARLDRQHAAEVVSAVAGKEPLSDETVAMLVDRADGVPLYVEEITKSFIEGAGRPTERPSDPAAPELPETLQDSLAARLDRLGSGKFLAQQAAVIGRAFDFALLNAVAGRPADDLRAELDRLVRADILHRKGTPPNETFVFRHELIREAAYASLLRRVRHQHHLRVVDALRNHFPAVAQAQPELLAHHYAGAGRASEAIAHWLLAAQYGLARSAFSEAIKMLTRALEELSKLPAGTERDRTEIDLRSALGLALISTKGWAVPEVEVNYDRLQRLCEGFGAVPVQVLYGIWGVQLVRGDRDGATRLAARFRALRDETEDPGARVTADGVLGVFAFYSGQTVEAAERFRAAQAAMRRTPALREQLAAGSQHHAVDAYVYAELYLSFCLQNLGALNEAKAAWREVSSLLESTGHPFLVASALAFGVIVAQVEGDADETVRLAERATPLCVEHDFHYWLAIVRCAAGWARAVQSRGEQGIAEIVQGLNTLRFLGSLVIYPFFAGFLAEARMLRGELDDAAATVDDALEILRDRLCQSHAPRLLFLRGEIERRRGETAAAVAAHETALERATAAANLPVAIDSAHRLGLLLDEKETDRAARAAGRLAQLLAAAPDGMTHPRFAAARDWLRGRRG
jgi:predicted ATPase/class 3 adenylate cyclase